MKYSIYIIILLVMLGSVSGAIDAALTVSLVNQDPDPAQAGDIVEVRIGLENQGNEAANNIVVELAPEYPFSLVTGESAIQNVGTIGSYQLDEEIKILKYRMAVDKDVIAGSYDLDVKYYTEGSNVVVTKTVTIDIESRESLEIENIDLTSLVPGREDEMTFTIRNVGSAPLSDIIFSWENEEGVILSVGSDNSHNIKHLAIDEVVEVTFKVIADSEASPGLYGLDLSLSYDEGGMSQVLSTTAGLYVGGGTDFDIAYSENSNGEISFTIANVGSNPASSVTVSVPKQTGWKISGPNAMIIGNLEKGDYTVASFMISSSSDTVNLDVTYSDTRGERVTVNKDVTVAQSSRTTESGDVKSDYGTRKNPMGSMGTVITGAKYVGFGIVLVIVGIVAWSIMRKRKSKRRR